MIYRSYSISTASGNLKNSHNGTAAALKENGSTPNDSSAQNPVEQLAEPTDTLADDIHSRFAQLESEFQASVLKIDETQDKLLRALADQQNERNRFHRELEAAKQFAVSNFAKSLLEVADTMQMAIKAVDDIRIQATPDMRSIVDGINMTNQMLTSVFEKHGITQYDPAGQMFDPKLHEALFELEDPTKQKGEVAQVLQCGYKIQDRVLRAAKVGVAKSVPVSAGKESGSTK